MTYMKKQQCIGYLSTSHKITPLKKACANYARAFDFKFIIFTPEDFSFDTLQVDATIIRGSKVQKKVVPLPDVIIDRFRGKGDNVTYKRFYQEITENSLINNSQDKRKLNKVDFQNCLEENNLLSTMRIATLNSATYKNTMNFINKNKKVILKPTSSFGGRGIYYIEQTEEGYVLLNGVYYENISSSQIESKLKEILKEEYIIQKYINSVDKNQRPFDIRIHVMKGYQGKWQVAAYYVRIGDKDGIVSNLSAGGYIDRVESFFEKNKELFEDENVDTFINKLIDIGLYIVHQIERFLPKGLSHIGLDLAFNFEEQTFYLFEVNTYLPGATYFEHSIAENLIGYAVHLYEKYNQKKLKRLYAYPKTNVIAANVDDISTYLIMLEAWRRGLIIQTFYKEEAFQYKISDGQNTYIFNQAVSSIIPLKIKKIINDSKILRQLLKKNNVKLYKATKEKRLEKYRKFNVLIINNQMISLVEKKELVLKGDGIRTIEQLVERESEYFNFIFQTKQNEQKMKFLNMLKQNGYTLNDQLAVSEKLIIRDAKFEFKNHSIIEKEEVYKKIKETVKKVVSAVSEPAYLEVELLLIESKEILVSDININPKLEIYMYPDEGNSVNVVEEFLNIHFNSRKIKEKVANYITFDLREVQKLSINAPIRLVTLNSFSFNQKNQLFIVNSSKLSTKGRRNIKKIFSNNDLHGHIKISDEYFEIHCNGKNILKVKQYLNKHFSNAQQFHQISNETIVLGYREYIL